MTDSDFAYEPSREDPLPTRMYERELDGDLRWALNEGGLHFEEKGHVHRALRKLARRLDDLGVAYAVVGAMGMYGNGYRRFTEDIDLLVTSAGLAVIHEKLEGSGYRPPFAGSKNLRDTEFGVRIEFLIAGEYPGDGKPKPVAFPVPDDVGFEIDGIRYANVETILELKLASGMTNPGRAKDIGDAQEVIKALHLPRGLAERLNPFVADKYRELWDGAQLDDHARE